MNLVQALQQPARGGCKSLASTLGNFALRQDGPSCGTGLEQASTQSVLLAAVETGAIVDSVAFGSLSHGGGSGRGGVSGEGRDSCGRSRSRSRGSGRRARAVEHFSVPGPDMTAPNLMAMSFEIQASAVGCSVF